jgi:hypothetical protein
MAALPTSGQVAAIGEILAKVDSDSLLHTVRVLSGAEAAVTPDSTYWITTRWYENNDGALHYVRYRLESYGYSTSLQPFVGGAGSLAGTNALGVRTGTSEPSRHVIICAHYDAVTETPGADDNASGTAAVLEAARVLAPYTFASTVVFALWDTEEQGLVGSAHYAADAANTETEIAAVINLDMVGWDGDGDGIVEVHTDVSSLDLAKSLAGYASTHALDVTPVIIEPGTNRSDHASFWRNGYQAVLLIEEFSGGDFNENYHQPTDVVQHLDADFLRGATSLAVAGIAEIATVMSVGTDLASELRAARLSMSAHPSPFMSSVTVDYEVPTAVKVRISLYDLLGRRISTVVEGWHSAGQHQSRWSSRGLPPGIYFLAFEAGGAREIRPIVKAG